MSTRSVLVLKLRFLRNCVRLVALISNVAGAGPQNNYQTEWEMSLRAGPAFPNIAESVALRISSTEATRGRLLW